MDYRRVAWTLVLLLVVPGVAGANEDLGLTTSSAAALLLPIRNARVPIAGVLSGGQPTEEQFEAAAAAGFRTVINLRTEKEPGFEWEAELVEELGMRYVLIPVAGAQGLTQKNVKRLDRALGKARDLGPVLLHCGSGNRIGAMLALRAAWIEDQSPEDALAYGRASGLTGLEQTTREILGLSKPAAEDAPRE